MGQSFLISPPKLRKIQRRCKPIVSQLLELDLVSKIGSPFLPDAATTVIATTDRYGLSIRTAICHHTGLVYLVDHFTQDAYASFYEDGIYRELITRFKNREQTVLAVEQAQRNYTERLVSFLRNYIPIVTDGKLLDIGGSTGLTAKAFRDHFNYDVTVLEPAADEVAAAQRLGINAMVGSIETWETNQKYDVILLCRTVEHVFDLGLTLQKIRTLLKPNGIFFCDIVDYIDVCQREGPPRVTSKIDHKQWLCQENAPWIFGAYGFHVEHSFSLAVDQIGFLMSPSDATHLEMMPTDWINNQIRAFRQIESAWMQHANMIEKMKRKVYPLKKRLLDR